MKRATATAILLLATATPAPGQTAAAPAAPEKPQTKLEAFLATRGSLLVKDFYEAGRIGGMSISAVVLTEPGKEEQRIRGIRVEVTEYGRLERTDTSFLDLEEVEDLSKALTYMAELAAKWAPAERQEYTEVQFATKGNFSIGFYQRKKEQGAFASSGSVGKVHTFIKVADLGKAKDLIDQSVALLKSK